MIANGATVTRLRRNWKMNRIKTPDDIYDKPYLNDTRYIKKKVDIAETIDFIILHNLPTYNNWVDLGSQTGKYNFINLMKTPHLFLNRIAVEIDSEYAKQDVRPEWLTINQDLFDFIENLVEVDIITIFDVIEHLPKDKGIQLLEELKQKAKMIILTTPRGFDSDQNKYEFTDRHITERHISGYMENELESLGFTTIVLKDYHIDKKDKNHTTGIDNLLAFYNGK